MKQLVIFDLDGTLLDTIEDLAAACNAVLTNHDMPTYDIETYRGFVGNGIMRLVERIIPEEERTPEYVKELRGEFLEYYFEHIAVGTKIYPGVMELLTKLQKEGVAMAVASNKFHDGTRKLVAHYFPNIHFDAVLGQRPDVPLKPNPQIIRDVMNITAHTAENTLFVGDSGVDIETAKAANVESVGVTWGFRTRAELQECGASYIVDKADKIFKLTR